MLKGNHDKPPEFKGILFADSFNELIFVDTWLGVPVCEDLYAAMKNHLSQGVKAGSPSQPGLKKRVYLVVHPT